MPLVIAGLILSFLVMRLFDDAPPDRALDMLIRTMDAPRLKAAAAMIMSAGSAIPLILITAAGMAWLLFKRDARRAIKLGGVVLAGHALVWAVEVITTVRDHRRLLGTQTGFPDAYSGNTTIALVAFAYLTTRRRPFRPLALGLAVFVALTIGTARVITLWGSPSEVIGGWALGLAWTLLLLLLAGEDLGDGTGGPLRHSPAKENIMENRRTETARQTDDSDLIENLEDTPSVGSASGGQLQRDVGTRAELERGEVGEEGTSRVRDSNKSDGDANLPRFNEK